MSSITRKEAKTNILLYFISEFNETVPIHITNQDDFKLCTNPLTNTTKPSNSPWVIFEIRNISGDPETYGNRGKRRWRRRGMISAQVFTPQGTGTSAGDTICEEFKVIFEGDRLDSITFKECQYNEVGINASGWMQHNITCFYFFDETR